MWLQIVRIYKRTGAFMRRLLDKDIVASDLAIGTYRREVSDKQQTVRNHTPYTYRTRVSKGDKSWIVISDKLFQEHFTVVKDGTTNKVVE